MDIEILQFFNAHPNLFLDGFASVLTHGATWIPFYIALCILVIKNNKTMSQIFLIVMSVMFCVLMSGVLSDVIVKPLTERLRPCDDPNVSPLLHLVDGVHASGYSFFSSHAANTFSVAVFLSLLTRSGMLSAFLLLWSLVNAWTRLYLGVHYPSDVLVGLLWGGIVGLSVYLSFVRLYVKIFNKTHYVSTSYTSTGYSVRDIYIVLNVMIMTVVCAIFISII